MIRFDFQIFNITHLKLLTITNLKLVNASNISDEDRVFALSFAEEVVDY